jgi:ABC transporter with metal-binding/Fe-S-binding domain ATP-binding protein
MKAVALFSGGKDSFLSMQIAQESGYEVISAVTVLPEEFSLMFHFPNADKSLLPAKFLGVSVIFCKEENLRETIESFYAIGARAIVSGAIASDYQKTKIEQMCTELGMISFTPLWRKNQESVLNELLVRGIKAVIVSVSAEGLTRDDLGKTIDSQYILHLKNTSLKRKINIAGEGGEYESFVYGVPGRPEIDCGNSEKVWDGSRGYLLLGHRT